jgi:hypothetical protein
MKSDGGMLAEVYLNGTTTRFRRAATGSERRDGVLVDFEQRAENKGVIPTVMGIGEAVCMKSCGDGSVRFKLWRCVASGL